MALAVGVLVGGALQFFMQVPALVRRGMRFRFRPSLRIPGVRTRGTLDAAGVSRRGALSN